MATGNRQQATGNRQHSNLLTLSKFFALTVLVLSLVAGMSLTAYAEGEVKYLEGTWEDTAGKCILTKKSVDSYTVVDSSCTSWANGTTYVVNSNVTIDDRITVTGTVNLILCDGVTLTASKGITVSSGNTLNIYGPLKSSNMHSKNTGKRLNACYVLKILKLF